MVRRGRTSVGKVDFGLEVDCHRCQFKGIAQRKCRLCEHPICPKCGLCQGCAD